MTQKFPPETTRDAPTLAPEAVEEEYLRARIEAVRGEIAGLAAELEELRTTLAAFEARYDARIGILIVELDRVELELVVCRKRIAALRESAEAWEAAEVEIERAFAGERARIGGEAQEARQAGERAERLLPEPPTEVASALRTQYRKLALRFHPDVAANEEERAFNESAMRRINVAMERRDLTSLETLALQLPSREVELPGPTAGARVAWAAGEVARLEGAVARLTGELAAERATSLHTLWQRAEREPSLLDRLEADLRRELATRQMELHALSRDYDRLLGERMTGGVLRDPSPTSTLL